MTTASHNSLDGLSKHPLSSNEHDNSTVRNVCIVIPAYNEEHAIASTVMDYQKIFPFASIVVVDNNSTDRTVQIVERVLRKDLDFLLTERQQGKGAAIKTGLSRVPAEIYIMVDGDGTYPATEAARLLDLMERARCDMVVGDRVSGGAYKRQNIRRGHDFGNRFLSSLVSQLAGKKYLDVLSGLRVMSRPFVSMLDVRSTGFQLETELNVTAAYLRASVEEVQIDYMARPEGSSSKLNTIRDGLQIAWFAFLNWVAFFPLHAFGLLSAVSFVISGFLGIRVFLVYIELGAMPYTATATAAASAGLVGLQSFVGKMLLNFLRNGVSGMHAWTVNWIYGYHSAPPAAAGKPKI
jgi:glycosyltransferase involved in cell wall biosynthesis